MGTTGKSGSLAATLATVYSAGMSTVSPFKLISDYKPTGDQPGAIAALRGGLDEGQPFMTLEGVTGSGKTFTVANVVQHWGKPALVISHNKTLAAQLYAELKDFFPESAVEYFVSYFDYYQPEAYIPQTDTYIEKDSSINEEIERLRLSATDALMNREDVILVASVSCIYGLGSPENYREMLVSVVKGERAERDAILEKLVDIQYTRNDVESLPGTFRVRGDTLDIYPSYAKTLVRIEFFGDEVDRIQRLEPLTGDSIQELECVSITPAKHFVTPYSRIEQALGAIEKELDERVACFERQNKLLEAQRVRMRTEFDLEMLREVGYCSGIENYSRYLTGRAEGERPFTLLDYFPSDFLTIIDESHVAVPQLRAMYNGDRARKTVLVEHGFRLPSALDNRPLNFEEFLGVIGPAVFTSATPGPFELQVGGTPVQQVIRPTGILDPPVDVRPLKGQIDDIMEEVRVRAAKMERVLVSTLTKKTAEDLAEYLQRVGLRVKYLHSEIDAIERVEILRGLRMAEFDCLVGINLLREGLDLPEVSLVAVLDADKEGFLRSETALIQTAGRAARHLHGRVILYADGITKSMRAMIDKTRERRERQEAYNKQHGITPRQIEKRIQESLSQERHEGQKIERNVLKEAGADYNTHAVVEELEQEMMEAAEALEFERAAMLRDQIVEVLGKKPAKEKRSRKRKEPDLNTRGRKKSRRK